MADVESEGEIDRVATKESEKSKGYLVIDYGEKIKADFKFSTDQIQQQLQHLQREIVLLWDIIRNLMVLLGPMMIGWLGFFISRMFFSRMWEGLWVVFNSFLMSTCLVMFMTPLNEALVRLLAAFEEFKDLCNNTDKFEDPTEETGDGDAGHFDTAEGSRILSNASEMNDRGTQMESDDIDEESQDDSVD